MIYNGWHITVIKSGQYKAVRFRAEDDKKRVIIAPELEWLKEAIDLRNGGKEKDD